MGNQRLLYRVHLALGTADPLDRADRLAVQLGQEQDAGVQGARALGIRNHNGAGPAVALVAAFLGAGQAPVHPQPIQKRPGRGFPLDPNRRSVQ